MFPCLFIFNFFCLHCSCVGSYKSCFFPSLHVRSWYTFPSIHLFSCIQCWHIFFLIYFISSSFVYFRWSSLLIPFWPWYGLFFPVLATLGHDLSFMLNPLFFISLFSDLYLIIFAASPLSALIVLFLLFLYIRPVSIFLQYPLFILY
jgi:hypothetical protein